jgi:flagellar protein FliO/FliZ
LQLARPLALAVIVITSATALNFASVAYAAESFAAPETAAAPAPAATAGSLAQVTLSLVVVLAAVFIAAWLMRRLRNFGRLGAGAIKIVADVALGAKERAVLVQVGEQQVLLGVAPGRVNTLHVLAEPVRLTGAPGEPPVSPVARGSSLAAQVTSTPRPDFKAILKRSLGL